MTLRTLIAGLLIRATAFAADAGVELFQKAMTQERAAGNLEEAIKLCQQVAKDFAADRALAAKALVAEARCYEKLGQDKAVKLYEQVAHDYKDQRELAATANARLAALREHAVAPTTITQRKIPFSSASVAYLALTQTDGQRMVFKDSATGALMMSDLAGSGKRVIFRPKERVVDNFIVSRDFSLLLMNLIRPDKSYTWAVVRADGTGFREIAGNWAGLPWPCDPEISWDNRSVLLCQRQPSGSSQLVLVSVADGQIHNLRECDIDTRDYRFSPDGRFIAIKTEAAHKIFVMPSQGGEPQLVAENARLRDWTRDGRYLIFSSDYPGATDALYLAPGKDGRSAGDRVLIRYGAFGFGRSTANGARILCDSSRREYDSLAWEPGANQPFTRMGKDELSG